MIESLDACVGRVVDKVDQLGLAELTLIVFTSDNGGLHVPEGPGTPATHNRPYRAGKGFCYEGTANSARRALDRPRARGCGGRYAGDQHRLDAHAVGSCRRRSCQRRCARLAHATRRREPGRLDARSRAAGAVRLYWHLPHYTNQGGRPAGAIREGVWKLIEYYEDGRLELFRLTDDPGEATDLSAAEPRAAELRGKLEAWRRAAGAQVNAANPRFNGATWRQLYHDVDVSRLPAAQQASSMAEKLAAWSTRMGRVLPGSAAGG